MKNTWRDMATKKIYTERIFSKKTKQKKKKKESYPDHSSRMTNPRWLQLTSSMPSLRKTRWRICRMHNSFLISVTRKRTRQLVTFNFLKNSFTNLKRQTDANEIKHLKCCDNERKRAETQDFCATLWSIFAMLQPNKPFNIHNTWTKICFLINCIINCALWMLGEQNKTKKKTKNLILLSLMTTTAKAKILHTK